MPPPTSRLTGSLVVGPAPAFVWCVFTIAPNGTEATLYFIDPGETCVLALNCLFNDLLYPAWVEAEEETGVAVVPGALYRSLFEREPAIQELTVHALSSVVLRLMTELEEVHSHRVDQRLASFLLNQASSEGVVRRTQQEIAPSASKWSTRPLASCVIVRWLCPKMASGSGGMADGRPSASHNSVSLVVSASRSAVLSMGPDSLSNRQPPTCTPLRSGVEADASDGRPMASEGRPNTMHELCTRDPRSAHGHT